MTLDDALRKAIAEAVAEGISEAITAGFQESLSEIRAVVLAVARSAPTVTPEDVELARIAQRDYLTVPEAAKLLRIGANRVYKLIGAGKLKSSRIGTRHVIARADLDAFMALHQHHALDPFTPSVRRALRASEAN